VTNLQPNAGLPILLRDETGEITFGDSVLANESSVRTFAELRSVLAHPASETRGDEDVIYRLFRGVVHDGDQAAFAEQGMRYDITVLLPGNVDGEFLKTAGHTHTAAPDGTVYPELYDVLAGSGVFLLQWADPLRLVVVLSKPGDRVLVPPGVSHLTINTGTEPMVVADLVAAAAVNEYQTMRSHQGAAIYLMRDPEVAGSMRQVINPHYAMTPTWQTIEGSRVGDFAPSDGSLYDTFIAHPEEFRYLTAPAAYDADMQQLWSERRAER